MKEEKEDKFQKKWGKFFEKKSSFLCWENPKGSRTKPRRAPAVVQYLPRTQKILGWLSK